MDEVSSPVTGIGAARNSGVTSLLDAGPGFLLLPDWQSKSI